MLEVIEEVVLSIALEVNLEVARDAVCDVVLDVVFEGVLEVVLEVAPDECHRNSLTNNNSGFRGHFHCISTTKQSDCDTRQHDTPIPETQFLATSGPV